MNNVYFTIGHSNRSIGEFIELLRESEIEFVADIRKIPMSKSNPQFNYDSLPASISPYNIGYEHLSALGGLRKKSKLIPSAFNAFWQNRSFHNYADYALSDGFQTGLNHLLDLGGQKRTVIMCSEILWWRCHRRIVTDYLIANNNIVFHIIDKHQVNRANLTPSATIRSDNTIIYCDTNPLTS